MMLCSERNVERVLCPECVGKGQVTLVYDNDEHCDEQCSVCDGKGFCLVSEPPPVDPEEAKQAKERYAKTIAEAIAKDPSLAPKVEQLKKKMAQLNGHAPW